MKLILKMCVPLFFLVSYMFWSAFRSNLVKQTVEVPSVHGFKPFQLLFIADVHRRKLSPEMFDFPIDCVIVGGDLTERGVPLSRIERNLKVLSDQAQVFFIWGNNDRETDELQLRRLFGKYNVRVLDNESVRLFNEPHLILSGSDHFLFDPWGLDKTFKHIQQDDTVIFVSHTPFVFDRVREQYPVDFMLAGHTHGGQIRIGKMGVFKKGSFRMKEGVPQLITNGFGTTALPLRLGAKAEFHLLHIKPRRQEKNPGWQKWAESSMLKI